MGDAAQIARLTREFEGWQGPANVSDLLAITTEHGMRDPDLYEQRLKALTEANTMTLVAMENLKSTGTLQGGKGVFGTEGKQVAASNLWESHIITLADWLLDGQPDEPIRYALADDSKAIKLGDMTDVTFTAVVDDETREVLTNMYVGEEDEAAERDANALFGKDDWCDREDCFREHRGGEHIWEDGRRDLQPSTFEEERLVGWWSQSADGQWHCCNSRCQQGAHRFLVPHQWPEERATDAPDVVAGNQETQ